MHSFAWWPTLIVLAVATFTDLRNRRIPNWLVLPFLLAGFVVSGWLHGWHGVGQSFAGMGLALLINGIAFWMGWTGAGDVKLFAAIGAWIGPVQMFWAFFFTSIAGGFMVLCWVVYSKFLKGLFAGAGQVLFGSKEHGTQSILDAEPVSSNFLKRKMPYAPAIAIGTLISFFAH
jgi:prepilin peptidase CpaA